MKLKKSCSALFVITFLFCNLFLLNSYGLNGEKVDVRIESFDRTIVEDTVLATTFLEAVQRAANGHDIIVSQDNKEKKIDSVDGIKNNAAVKDCKWYGFVLRNGNVMQSSDYLDIPLQNGDKVVLYYGNQSTKVTVPLQEKKEANKLTLTAQIAYDKWSLENGKTQSKSIVEPLSGVNIHIEMPDGTQQMMAADPNGQSVFSFNKIGYYTYYAEKYIKNKAPEIVKTEKVTILFGVKDLNGITRGEFAAILCQRLGLEKNTDSIHFSDIKGNISEQEILKAVSAGFLSGYTDGRFMPNQKITLLESVVALSRFYKEDDLTKSKIEGVPEWAWESVNKAIKHNIIESKKQNFDKAVSVSELERMLSNMKE